MSHAGWVALSVLLIGAPECGSAEPPSATKTTKLSLPSGVEVTIVEAPFVASDNHVRGCGKDGGPCLINGHPPFGVSFGLPKTWVKSIRVSFGGTQHSLDSSNMYNSWGSRPLSVGDIRYLGGRCDKPGYCTIRGVFGDGAGTFVVQWAVYDGVTFRNVITSADDVVDLFIKHIDPPQYD